MQHSDSLFQDSTGHGPDVFEEIISAGRAMYERVSLIKVGRSTPQGNVHRDPETGELRDVETGEMLDPMTGREPHSGKLPRPAAPHRELLPECSAGAETGSAKPTKACSPPRVRKSFATPTPNSCASKSCGSSILRIAGCIPTRRPNSWSLILRPCPLHQSANRASDESDVENMRSVRSLCSAW